MGRSTRKRPRPTSFHGLPFQGFAPLQLEAAGCAGACACCLPLVGSYAVGGVSCRGSALAVHAHTYELFSRRFRCADLCSVHRGVVDSHSSGGASDGLVVASLGLDVAAIKRYRGNFGVRYRDLRFRVVAKGVSECFKFARARPRLCVFFGLLLCFASADAMHLEREDQDTNATGTAIVSLSSAKVLLPLASFSLPPACHPYPCCLAHSLCVL